MSGQEVQHGEPEDVLLRYVQFGKTDECWLWTGPRDADGYGEVKANPWRGWRAHRAMYTWSFGEIPEGLFVCHRCDNPPCVNPAHLFLGTAFDNVADMVQKGRQTTGDTPALKRGRMIAHEKRRLPEALCKRVAEVYRSTGMTQAEVGQMFGISQQAVSLIIRSGQY